MATVPKSLPGFVEQTIVVPQRLWNRVEEFADDSSRDPSEVVAEALRLLVAGGGATAAGDFEECERFLMMKALAPLIDRQGLTLIGLSVGNLVDVEIEPAQLLLPFGRKDGSGLDPTIDQLRERFGHAAVTRASLLGRRQGFDVPKLPD